MGQWRIQVRPKGWRYDLLFALLLTATLSIGGMAYAWLTGRTYPEGILLRFLVGWAIAFCGILFCLWWERRRGRSL